MKKSWNNLSFGLIISLLVLVSCKEEIIDDYTLANDVIKIPADLEKVQLDYNFLFDMRFGWSNPYLKNGDNFIFYESGCIFYKYNMLSNEWTGNYSYTNSTANHFNRRFIINSSDSIIILASNSTLPDHFSLMSLQIPDLSMKYLKRDVQFEGDLYFSPVTSFENKLIVLLQETKKLLIVDLGTYNHSYIKKFPFNEYLSGIYTHTLSGKHKGFFYIYFNRIGRFFKMNLETYDFKEITLPDYFKKVADTGEYGGLVGNLFCFWLRNSYYTLCYDVENNKWLTGGENPFGQDTSPNLCLADDGLYFNTGISKQMFKNHLKNRTS